ncbi:hypothetical protein E7T09_08660 [Deinococcus sp. KSM4-11]|uniref:hypothetical protein n=1 Tax=Deinococcus sp. KSM4-11 TaxID=2568654 RepID=UPI0010A49DFD|nr:hypothetical protein [Deinococcus sp. KSM4-11]THF87213.1 hypothetical protein E7T09_08660 [Deinococcus sp. KSM4-11]
MFDEVHLHALLTRDARPIRESGRAYAELELRPEVAVWWDSAERPVRRVINALSLLEPTIPEA